MEIVTLATTAIALASPFLEKVGEGTAKKIGEDIWNLIKTPFQKKNKDIDKMDKKEIQATLVEVLHEDQAFRSELESFVTNIQVKVDNVNQAVNNNGNVEKQVNIGSNIGNITL